MAIETENTIKVDQNNVIMAGIVIATVVVFVFLIKKLASND